MRFTWGANGKASSLRHYAIWSAVLLCVLAAFFAYWTSRESAPAPAAPSSSPETRYYTQLVYAVNEMHNQVEQFEALRKQGPVPQDRVRKEETYADSLMAPLASPPEELSVAQYIAEQLYKAYHQYVQEVKDDSASLPETSSAFRQVNHNVDLFRQNAQLITVLNAYSGVNVYCH